MKEQDAVFELCYCEEYWMQGTRGLYKTVEGAKKAIVEKVLLEVRDAGSVFIVTLDEDHYSDPDPEKVVTRKGVVVTADNFWEVNAGYYDFYDIIHNGYNLYGIIMREVEE